MSWRIYPELGIERWLSSEDPPPAVVDAVLWVWLPVLETFGPFAQEAEVGLLLYSEDNGFVSLQLPDAVAPRHVAEGFADHGDRLFVILTISSAHP